MVVQLDQLIGKSELDIRNAIDSEGGRFNQLYDSIQLLLLPQNPVLIRPTLGSNSANSIYSLDIIKKLPTNLHPQSREAFILKDVYIHPFDKKIAELAARKESLVQRIASGKIEELANIQEQVNDFFDDCDTLNEEISNAFEAGDEVFLYAEPAFSEKDAPPQTLATRYINEMSHSLSEVRDFMTSSNLQGAGVAGIVTVMCLVPAYLIGKSTLFFINESQASATPLPPPPRELQETHRIG